jgi:hypothetical protein
VLAATGFVDRLAAQEVHQMAGEARAAAGGMYSPKALLAHDHLERLTDLIIPVEKGRLAHWRMAPQPGST